MVIAQCCSKLTERSRRLGLAGAPEEKCERQAIMAQYAKMAQKVGPAHDGTSQDLTIQIFQCDHVGVVIYRDEVQEKYGSDVRIDPAVEPRSALTSQASADPYVMAINKSIATHSVCYGKEKCFIVRDIEADWRFRGMEFTVSKRPRVSLERSDIPLDALDSPCSFSLRYHCDTSAETLPWTLAAWRSLTPSPGRSLPTVNRRCWLSSPICWCTNWRHW